MKLQDPVRINKEDFDEDDQQLIDKLNNPINLNIEQLYEMGKNGITFEDNFSCTVRTFTVTLDSSGIPKSSVSVALSKKNTTVTGTLVINVSGNAYPTAGVFVSGTKSGASYSVQHIAGLPANTPFSVTLIIFQG